MCLGNAFFGLNALKSCLQPREQTSQISIISFGQQKICTALVMQIAFANVQGNLQQIDPISCAERSPFTPVDLSCIYHIALRFGFGTNSWSHNTCCELVRLLSLSFDNNTQSIVSSCLLYKTDVRVDQSKICFLRADLRFGEHLVSFINCSIICQCS